MALRISVAVSLVIVCLICGAVTACGVTKSEGVAAQGLTLHVVRIAPGATRPSLDTYVDDGAAIQQIYTAALKLPMPRRGAIFNCPPDNGVEYHLTFVGGTVTEPHMDLDAAGCRFLVIGQQVHITDDAFVALFIRTVGIPVLDPSLG